MAPVVLELMQINKISFRKREAYNSHCLDAKMINYSKIIRIPKYDDQLYSFY